jgi:hypothetical protein
MERREYLWFGTDFFGARKLLWAKNDSTLAYLGKGTSRRHFLLQTATQARPAQALPSDVSSAKRTSQWQCVN